MALTRQVMLRCSKRSIGKLGGAVKRFVASQQNDLPEAGGASRRGDLANQPAKPPPSRNEPALAKASITDFGPIAQLTRQPG